MRHQCCSTWRSVERRTRRSRGPRLVLLSLTVAAFTLVTPLFGVASSSSTETVPVAADAGVQEAHPDTNLGGDSEIRVDGTSPVSDAYLRFDLSGITDSIDRASLRVYVENGGKDGFEVHGVADSSWGETALTWANKPAIGSTVASSGPLASGDWVSVDVTSVVRSGGPVTIALTSPVASPLRLASREAGSATAPQLVIETSATPPTNTILPSISGDAVEGSALAGSPGEWSGTQPITFTYAWQRCDAAGANCTSIAGATSSSYTLSSADVGATVRVAVTGSNSGGQSTATSSATAVVAATIAVAPSPTTRPVVSGTAQEGQTLSTTDGTWSGSLPMTFTYDWLRCDASGSNCIAISGATHQTYTLTSAEVSSTIRARVTATNSAGSASESSLPTALVTASPAPADTTPPSAPANLVTTGETQTSIGASWDASSDNVGVVGYDLYVDGSKISSTTATAFSFSGLTCATTYTLGVEAFDAAGNRSTRTSIAATTAPCLDTSAPSAPSGLTVTATTQSSIALSWTASTDNVAVTGYDVLIGGSRVDSTTATGYTVPGLTCGTSYTVGVDAFDAAGNRSTVASTVAATAACPDSTPPSAPSALTVTATTVSSILLSWNASSDNVAVTGYDVYVNSSKVGSTATTSYTFSGLACGTSYTLAVAAVDAAGNRSSASSIVTATAACAVPAGYQHVVWIVMENQSYDQIIGNTTSAPYINQLAQTYGSATQMYAISHPSLPNYIAMTSGSTQGITDDNGPTSHPLAVDSIFSELGLGGWRSLEESMPSNCYLSNSGNYAVRHNPAAYYTNIAAQCAAQDVPLAGTPDVSTSFTFITPNLCHDMHSNSCSGSSDVILQGDQWLQSFVPQLLSSPEYQSGNTVIFLTWDEDNSCSGCANHIPTIVISPTSKGITSGTTFSLYSLLRTTEEILGVPLLGGAATANSMRSDFHL